MGISIVQDYSPALSPETFPISFSQLGDSSPTILIIGYL